MLGSLNATTEFATLWWLNEGRQVERQTGHCHAQHLLNGHRSGVLMGGGSTGSTP